jgi:hypothetical protein
MLIDTGIVNLDDEFNVSGDLGFRLGMNVLDFLDEYSSSSSRTLGFDRKKAERENWNVFLVILLSCVILSGMAMIWTSYIADMCICRPMRTCHVTMSL